MPPTNARFVGSEKLAAAFLRKRMKVAMLDEALKRGGQVLQTGLKQNAREHGRPPHVLANKGTGMELTKESTYRREAHVGYNTKYGWFGPLLEVGHISAPKNEPKLIFQPQRGVWVRTDKTIAVAPVPLLRQTWDEWHKTAVYAMIESLRKSLT